MANYPFRINIQEKDGGRRAYFTSSLVTNADTLVSASIMVDKINLMRTSSFVRAATGSHDLDSATYNHGSALFSYHNSVDARSNAHVSVSYTEPNTGSVVFHDLEVESRGEGLDYYEFYGTKVCSVLGLPEGIPIYTENFKLSDDADLPDNYLSGDVIANGIAVKESFKIAPQGRVKGNLVWDDVFGEGFVQWVSGSTVKMSMGYDNITDNYDVNAPTGSIKFLQTGTSGKVKTGEIIPASTNIQIGNNGYDLTQGTGDVYIGEGKIVKTTTEGGTDVANGCAEIFLGSDLHIDLGVIEAVAPGSTTTNLVNRLFMNETGELRKKRASTATFPNDLTAASALFRRDFDLVLSNRTETQNAFAGIAFVAGQDGTDLRTETTSEQDCINGSIVVMRDNATANNYASNMVFATNPDSDDDLIERMRITHDGKVGILNTDPTGSLTVGTTSRANDTKIVALADDDHKAGFEAYGNSQGTGYVYTGQSTTFGGGMFYNGDGAPAFTADEFGNDYLSFFRRSSGTPHTVFGFHYNSDEVRFVADVVAFYSSDERLKKNVIPIGNSIEKVKQIRGVEFDWIPKKDSDGSDIHRHEGHDVGVIAQEIEKVLPEVVETRDNGYKAVKYEKIVPLLIESIKEQQKQIDELKKELKEIRDA